MFLYFGQYSRCIAVIRGFGINKILVISTEIVVLMVGRGR
jgi:hypothetical protein